MGLWHIGSQTDLTGMYLPYDPNSWPPGYPPPSSYPSWWKGIWRNTMNLGISGVFFYIPSEDIYCWWGLRVDYPNFIGIFFPYGYWAALNINVRIFFRGESGEVFDYNEVGDRPTFPDSSAWAFAGGSIGSYERLYMTTKAWGSPYCYEIYWQTLASSGWGVSAYDTIPPTTYGTWGPIPIVNREDGYICWGGGTKFNLFRLEQDNLWHRYGIVNIPASVQAGTYENRQNMWWISTPQTGHRVGKLNYQTGNHEILTSVQPQYGDVSKNFIAFDTKRKRVAILRARPDDAVTGACRWAMDFYRPIVKVSELGITDPVPVISPRVGNRMVFKANLIGDVGESIAPHSVNVSMTAPVEGTLLTPIISSDIGGKIQPMYQALAIGNETMNLSVTVNEGSPDTQES